MSATMRASVPVIRASAVRRASVRCQAVAPAVQVQRQARRALLASVLAVPVVVATRPAFASEEGLGEVKDLDFRALILSTILMGVAGFTAVGAASTPDSGDAEHH